MKTRIHVNQHNIRANAKGADLPVLTVKTYKENVKCNRVAVHGPSTVVYSPDKPLSFGGGGGGGGRIQNVTSGSL